MFMDIAAALIILTPVFGPMAPIIGVNPLHFGIIFCIALNMGLMTPPVGGCLFVASAISKTSLEEISINIIPFIIPNAMVLFIVAYWEDLVLFLPRLLGFA